MTSSKPIIHGTTHFTPTINIQKKTCLRRRLNSYVCTLCIDNCHTHAINIKDNEIFIDQDRCTGCGRCTAVCPSETFTFVEYDLYDVLLSRPSADTIVISCFRHGSTYPAGLFIPCLAALNIESLLLISLCCKGNVFLNFTHCLNCINCTCSELVINLSTRLKELLKDILPMNLRVITDEEHLPAPAGKERRYYLQNLLEGFTTFVKSRHMPPIQSEMTPSRARRIVPKKTELLQREFHSNNELSSDTLIELCTPAASIKSICTSCPRCTAMCPTGALTLVQENGKKELIFNAARCNACNLCSTFCKEGAIIIKPAPILYKCLSS